MIEIKNLCKRFDSKTLFEDFNYTIEDGDFVVFCGESGCGKTTLLNMIGCLEKPNGGSIIIDGVDIWRSKTSGSCFRASWGSCFRTLRCWRGKPFCRICRSFKKRSARK